MPPSTVKVVRGNLQDPVAQESFLTLLDAYMRHPMGDSRPLNDELRPILIRDLKTNPHCHVFFAVDGDQPVGIANCFQGYSTFNARPVINIHDLFVEEAYRGQGVGLELLKAVEQFGREINCCRITLEVHDENDRARSVYSQYGFNANGGRYAFLCKTLD
jgi:GNAT superfamily N-acetyltransferase